MKGGKLVNDCRPKNEEVTNEAKKCWKGYEKKEPKNYSAKHTTAASKRKRRKMNLQPGQGKQEKQSLEDSTKKDASLTKEKILDLTLKHRARRLEIPGGHPSALE